METQKTQQIPYKLIITAIVLLVLCLYSFKPKDILEIDDEEATISLCQIRVQFDSTEGFDDRALVALLSTLKMHDFLIGQPVWGPSYTLLYLCEHRLKIGIKQSILDRELQHVIKNSPISSGHVAWSCA